jgi:two-component sensor histidine kinase
MHHVMSDIPLPANGLAGDEQPPAADERPPGEGPVRHSRRVFSRMAIVVILIFWTAQFTFLTVARLMRMPEESLSNIYPRAIVTVCAILLSFGLLATQRAVRRRTLVQRALIACALALAGCAIHAAVNMTAFTYFYGLDPAPVSEYLLSWLLAMADFIWYYSALSVMLLALTYGEDLVDNEDRIASLQAQANVAQLNALRYQLNPHFLFNTLNSVASLISKKMGAEAETMVVSLSDFLRSTLRMDSGREIILDEEIKLQSLYLDIEKIRFPQRLSVTIDVPADLRAACVPNLITQPLIENAIKHGVGRSSAPVHLEVIARDLGGRLSLEVRDDGGNASHAASAGTQVGLRNVAERLRLRYGGEGSLTAGPRAEGGFSAQILIPLRKA